MADDDWRDLGPEDGPAAGQLRLLRIDGHALCVGRTSSGEWFALDDVCPHAGGSLSEGMVDGRQVICPLHAYAFDIETGDCADDPSCRVSSYPIRLEDGRLQGRLQVGK